MGERREVAQILVQNLAASYCDAVVLRQNTQTENSTYKNWIIPAGMIAATAAVVTLGIFSRNTGSNGMIGNSASPMPGLFNFNK